MGWRQWGSDAGWKWSQVQTSVMRQASSGDVMYSVVTMGNSTFYILES